MKLLTLSAFLLINSSTLAVAVASPGIEAEFPSKLNSKRKCRPVKKPFSNKPVSDKLNDNTRKNSPSKKRPEKDSFNGILDKDMDNPFKGDDELDNDIMSEVDRHPGQYSDAIRNLLRNEGNFPDENTENRNERRRQPKRLNENSELDDDIESELDRHPGQLSDAIRTLLRDDDNFPDETSENTNKRSRQPKRLNENSDLDDDIESELDRHPGQLSDAIRYVLKDEDML
jgi:hypothetical protein